MELVKIVARNYDPKIDEAFVYATWTRNCYYSSKEPITAPKKQWFAQKTQYIKKLLETSDVRVACHQSDPCDIAGYVVVSRGKLEWLYIKKIYRDDGIEELLTNQLKEKNNEE